MICAHTARPATFRAALLLLLAGCWHACVSAGSQKPFRIQVVDEQTGRGVPLVELKTVNNVRYVTDSAGVAAIDEPGLEGQRVFFFVSSHGYEFPADGFGFRGKALDVKPGAGATLKIKRVNIAERLYRVTGGGIYRDSLLVGDAPPLARPVLNGQVLGSDSVVTALFRGRLYWFWGDTNRPGYPLGLFHVPGATSMLPSQGGLDPSIGVELEYFVGPDGFARPMAQMPGDGPTWIDGLTVLRDARGEERMLAAYVKVRKQLEVYARGMVEFDPREERFRQAREVPLDAPIVPGGHSLLIGQGHRAHVYFARAYPLARVPATAESYLDLDQYEAYTCLAEGSRLEDGKIERDGNGQPRYAWKHNTPAAGPVEQAALIRQGLLKPNEVLLQMRDADTGQPVAIHAGSVCWNDFRKRYVMIAVQTFGTSMLGELWYAEAETPVGPWVYARKIVTHTRYSFYNPKQHPQFDADGGRRIYFEGTFASTFSGNDNPTPRYDYNQVMYRLDLQDPRLVLPVAVYDISGGRRQRFATRNGAGGDGPVDSFDPAAIAFFAPDQPRQGLVPVWLADDGAGGTLLSTIQRSSEDRVAFYGIDPQAAAPPSEAVALYEWRDPADQSCAWLTAGDAPPAGHVRSNEPACLVWPSPWR